MYYKAMETVALTELPAFAQQVLERLPHAKGTAVVVALQGELGAGKTTFVQALAKVLGIAGAVQSPTYVLMKRYQTAHPVFRTLVHVDAYRLEKPEEFEALKPETFLNDPTSLVCIEWPERVLQTALAPDVTIRFLADGAGEQERIIDIL